MKAPPGSTYPSKIPVSGVVLSFIYLVQSPLPLALQLRRQGSKPGTAGKPSLAQPKGEAAQRQRGDSLSLLQLELKTLRDLFNNSQDESLSRSYLLNSLLFFCLLSLGTDSREGEESLS